MLKKINLICMALLLLFFAGSCGGNSAENKESDSKTNEKDVSENDQEQGEEVTKEENSSDEEPELEAAPAPETFDFPESYSWKGANGTVFTIGYSKDGVRANENPMGLTINMNNSTIEVPTVGRGFMGDIVIDEEAVKIGKGKKVDAVRKTFRNGESLIVYQYINNTSGLNISINGKNLTDEEVEIFDRMVTSLEMKVEEKPKKEEPKAPVNFSGRHLWSEGGQICYAIGYPKEAGRANINPMGMTIYIDSLKVEVPTVGRGYGPDVVVTEEPATIGKGGKISATKKTFKSGNDTVLVQYIDGAKSLNFCISGNSLTKDDILLLDQMASTLETVSKEELKEYNDAQASQTNIK